MKGKIPTRILGKTGIQLPIVGFGASPLGGVYQVRLPALFPALFIHHTALHKSHLQKMRTPCVQEPFNEEDGIKAVHEAYARGINYFDTSPYYGNLQSEKAGAPMLQYKLMMSYF